MCPTHPWVPSLRAYQTPSGAGARALIPATGNRRRTLAAIGRDDGAEAEPLGPEGSTAGEDPLARGVVTGVGGEQPAIDSARTKEKARFTP
jgi:hypothetical protein